jgi:putative hemolysin
MQTQELRQTMQLSHRSLSIQLARTEEDILDAQRLRYKVFAEEMGATLASAHEGIDRDLYDPYCDHLLVRDDATGEVVGTYRILTPFQAKRLGGLYAEEEFDLSRLMHLRHDMVEVGRSCVHPSYRNGGTIAMLWAGLAQYMQKNNYGYLTGCASISVRDGGNNAARIYESIKQEHLSPIEWRVFPRTPLPLDSLDHTGQAEMPPLIKGYLRLGAYICGEPAWDHAFNTADLLILMPMSRMNMRYLKHFNIKLA